MLLGLAVALCAGAFAWAFHTQFPKDGFLFLFMPMIAAGAYVGGRPAGLAATAAGVVMARYFVLPPAYSFAVSLDLMPILLLFVAVALGTAEAAARLREAEAVQARLYEAERRAHAAAAEAAHRTQRLQAVTAALSEALTPEQVAGVILHHAVDELGAAAATVTLLVDDARSLALLSAVGYSPDITERWGRTPADVQPIAEAMRTQQVVWYASWTDFLARYPKGLAPTEPARVGARVAVPLVVQERAIGALYMNFRERRLFGDVELQFMLTLGQQCAQALDRARLYVAEKTAHEAAEETAHRIQRLQAVTAALSGALTPSQVADVILTEGLRMLDARAGVIHRRRDDAAVLEMLHSVNYPGDVVQYWQHDALSEPSPLTAAVRTGTATYFESQDDVLARYPNLSGKVNPHRGGRVFVPLHVAGRTIGVLGFVFAQPKTFPIEERRFIGALADQCAQALERSQLYERQHRVAETLQRAFLPSELPAIPGIAIHSAYVPRTHEADVGGDWYDAFVLPDGSIAVSVGDVVGHGLQAAVVMGQLRQGIRAAALTDSDPGAVLATVNRMLTHSYGLDVMATAVLGLVDPAGMTLTYAVAGHPPPMLARDGAMPQRLSRGGVPLGIRAGVVFEKHVVDLTPGALLVLYTDGLVELTRNLDEGESALLAAVEAEMARPSIDTAQAILDRMLRDRTAVDDIAIVTIRMAAAPLDRFTFTVPAVPASVRLVRHTVRRLAGRADLTLEQRAELELAVGEAVSNVIEHAYGAGGGTVDVHARSDALQVDVEIEDHGRWRPERAEGRGHGLRLMRVLMDHVEVEQGTAGTTVKMMMRVAKGAQPGRTRRADE